MHDLNVVLKLHDAERVEPVLRRDRDEPRAAVDKGLPRRVDDRRLRAAAADPAFLDRPVGRDQRLGAGLLHDASDLRGVQEVVHRIGDRADLQPALDGQRPQRDLVPRAAAEDRRAEDAAVRLGHDLHHPRRVALGMRAVILGKLPP